MGKGGAWVLNMVRLCFACQKHWIWIWALPVITWWPPPRFLLSNRWARCTHLKGMEENNIKHNENKSPTNRLELSFSLCERRGHWWIKPGSLAILFWSIPSTEGSQVLHQPALHSAIVQKWNSVCFLNLESSQFSLTLSCIHAASPMTVDGDGNRKHQWVHWDFHTHGVSLHLGVFRNVIWLYSLCSLPPISPHTHFSPPIRWGKGGAEVGQAPRGWVKNREEIRLNSLPFSLETLPLPWGFLIGFL